MFEKTLKTPGCLDYGPLSENGFVVTAAADAGTMTIYKQIDGTFVLVNTTSLADCEGVTVPVAGAIGDNFKVCFDGFEDCVKVSIHGIDVVPESVSTLESDPLIVCSVMEPTEKFIVHPRYEDGVFAGWFNSAGEEVAEGVDFVICPAVAVVQPAREMCIAIESYPVILEVWVTDIMDSDGNIINQIVRDIAGTEITATYTFVGCDCDSVADVFNLLLADYYPIVITNIENGTPTEYSLQSTGSALPVLWLEEDGTEHTGLNFSVTYTDDGPRDVIAYVPKDATIVNLTGDSEEIAAVDTSDAINVTRLNLRTNQLTTLDMTQNVLVTYLDLRSNQLATSDISQNALLATLYISNNQLATFDATQNVLLTFLNIGNNQLATFDATQNVLLTFLDISNNQLATFDATQNVLLTSLYISNNQLATFDATQNVLLTRLYLNNNQLATAAVNDAVIALAAHGNLNGYCRLDGQSPPAPPSGAGITAINALVADGWTVITD